MTEKVVREPDDFSLSGNGLNVVWSWGGRVPAEIILQTIRSLFARVKELEEQRDEQEDPPEME